MGTTEALTTLIEPLLGALHVDLWDIELHGGVLRVAVDRDGGIDLDAVAEATRAISRALDEADPIAGRYTLEVSSPGVERTLRTPEHYRRSLGTTIKVKTVPGYDGLRRFTATLDAADSSGVTVTITGGDAEAIVAAEDADTGSVHLAYGDIERARTTFVWGPSSGQARPGARKGAAKHTSAGRRPAGSDRKAVS